MLLLAAWIYNVVLVPPFNGHPTCSNRTRWLSPSSSKLFMGSIQQMQKYWSIPLTMNLRWLSNDGVIQKKRFQELLWWLQVKKMLWRRSVRPQAWNSSTASDNVRSTLPSGTIFHLFPNQAAMVYGVRSHLMESSLTLATIAALRQISQPTPSRSKEGFERPADCGRLWGRPLFVGYTAPRYIQMLTLDSSREWKHHWVRLTLHIIPCLFNIRLLRYALAPVFCRK